MCIEVNTAELKTFIGIVAGWQPDGMATTVDMRRCGLIGERRAVHERLKTLVKNGTIERFQVVPHRPRYRVKRIW